MQTIKERIDKLKMIMTDINETVYPDNYGEAKLLMLNALQERINLLEREDL